MAQRYSLHTHTIGFDGRDTVSGMIERATENGLKTIGISNHFIVNPIIKNSKMYEAAASRGYGNIYSASFEEVLSRFVPHYAEIDSLREKYPNIKILRGMEVDFFNTPNWRDGFEQAVKILKPDYIIGSAHFVEYGGGLLNSHDWAVADKSTQDILLKTYWTNVANAAKSGLFTWMAHLDLPKKVGLGREDSWMEYENRAVQAAAESKTAIEINTSFYKVDCYEPYPSPRILQMAKNMGVPVLISDDAHNVKNMCRHFKEAEQLVQNLKLKRFDKIR